MLARRSPCRRPTRDAGHRRQHGRPGHEPRVDAAARDVGVDYLRCPGERRRPGGAGPTVPEPQRSVHGRRRPEAFERAKPTLAILGKRWFYLGPSGTGSTVKLISNLMAGLHNLVASEAFVLGAAAGIQPETLLEVFDGTDAKSFWLTDYFAPRIRRHDFDPGSASTSSTRTIDLASDLGRALGVPLFFNDLAVGVYQAMRASGSAARTWSKACGSSAGSQGRHLRGPTSAD